MSVKRGLSANRSVERLIVSGLVDVLIEKEWSSRNYSVKKKYERSGVALNILLFGAGFLCTILHNFYDFW